MRERDREGREGGREEGRREREGGGGRHLLSVGALSCAFIFDDQEKERESVMWASEKEKVHTRVIRECRRMKAWSHKLGINVKENYQGT